MSIINANDIIDTRIKGINLFQLLSTVYGAKGIPFPNKPKQADPSMVASGFDSINFSEDKVKGVNGVIKEYTDTILGQYLFLPCKINGYNIPNAVVIISGEKQIIETDVIESGTVFEKVFTRPYDISIISTIVGEDGQWPEDDYNRLAKLFKENDLVTLECASCTPYLQPKDNFIIKKIDVMDNAGYENIEVIQFNGRSNEYFELLIS